MRLRFAVPIIAAVSVTSAIAFTTAPASAGDWVYRNHYRMHHHYYRDYSGYMDPRSGHYDPEFQHNRENFGFSGRDPSRVGGEDPSLHPAPLGH